MNMTSPSSWTCRIRPAYALCLCCLGLSSASLQAEDSFFDLSLTELMEVEVASLFVEDELTVGSTVSKVTEAQWRNQGAEKTMDALAHLPGIYISEHLHGQKVPSFRGFTGEEQYNSYLLLLDGIPLNSYSSAAGTYGTPNYALGNLQNIEVIRGPGSSIYGADAFNGVVALNTWSSDENRQEAWIEGGSHGYQQLTARFRQSLGEAANLTSIISASTTHDEEVPHPFHPTPGAPLTEAEISGAYENLTTTHKLAIKDLELAFYYSKHEADDAIGTGEVAGALPNGHHTDGSAEMVAGKLSHAFTFENGVELASSLYHVQSKLLGALGQGTNVGAPPVPPSLNWDSKDTRTGANIMAKRPLNDSGLRMLLGYSYDELEVEYLDISVTGSQAPLVASDHRRTVHGLMGQLEQRLLDEKVQLIAGARYDDYSDFGGHTSPRLAAIYHPTPQSALKLLYGNAYRAPSVNEQSNNGIVKGGGPSLSPEVVDTYELVWIHAGRAWRYRLSTYQSEVKDSISIDLSTDPTFVLEYQNNVAAQSAGVEVEAIYQASSWQLYGNAAWNKSKQTEPSVNPNAYTAYPDVALNAGGTYHLNRNVALSLHNLVYDGFRSINRGPAIAPSYVDQGELSTFWRTDLHVSWRPTMRQADCELYLTILDLFDRQDVAASMNALEYSSEMPGRKLWLGARLAF